MVQKNVYYDSAEPLNCMDEYSKNSNYTIAIFLFILLLFITISIVQIRKVNKMVKAILELNENGKLIKNLSYRFNNTGITVNNVPIQRPIVADTLPSETVITLYGDVRHDKNIAMLMEWWIY